MPKATVTTGSADRVSKKDTGSTTRALVLSGGGAVAIAWEIGLTAGLARAGVDLREADFITGTSAGSAVGARIALRRPFEELLTPYRRMGIARTGSSATARSTSSERLAEIRRMVADLMSGDGTPEVRRAAVGRFALQSETLPEDALLAAFADLKGKSWPAHYYCPAIDAVTGEWVVWDAASAVELDRGVASSCCVPGLYAPITIKGRRYIDAGPRSGTSADLAKGHDRVLIISLIRGSARGAIDERMSYAEKLDREVELLRNSGSEVVVLDIDTESAKAMGANFMDLAVVPVALEAGLEQGDAEAARIRSFWKRT